MLRENEVAKAIVDVAYHIHRKLGPGLLESVYHAVMKYELEKRGLRVLSREPVPFVWEDVRLEVGFEADLIVEDVVVVELKSVEQVACAQEAASHLPAADELPAWAADQLRRRIHRRRRHRPCRERSAPRPGRIRSGLDKDGHKKDGPPHMIETGSLSEIGVVVADSRQARKLGVHKFLCVRLSSECRLSILRGPCQSPRSAVELSCPSSAVHRQGDDSRRHLPKRQGILRTALRGLT